MCAEKHPGGNPGCLARLNLPGADPELGFGEYEPSAPTLYLPHARWRRHVVPQGPVAIATNREASVVARRERKCNGDCPSTPDRRPISRDPRIRRRPVDAGTAGGSTEVLKNL